MLRFSICLFVTHVILLNSPVLAFGEKHALLIGVSKYPKEIGWTQLHAFRDVELIKQTLLNQRFKEKNILVVQDKQATRQGIINKLKELVGRLKEGDQVVICFSGHGQQIYDDNEDELDHLDESLVPYDAPMNISYEQYKGDKHIRDDELGWWINSIRDKIGSEGQVLVVLDSCNSSTATRGNKLVTRGGPPIVPQGWSLPITKHNEPLGFNDSFQTKNILRGRLVLFSGASANQTNFETLNEQSEPIGPLSDALCRAFKKVSNGATYRSLFADVQNRMAITSPYQTPTLEGDADIKVFQGGIVIQQAYYEISKVIADTVNLKAGILSGAAKGAQIGFYKSGTALPTPQSWLATGEVIQAGPFYSNVILKQGHLPTSPTEAWAFVTKQSYNDWSIKVSVDSEVPLDVRRTLLDSLHRQTILRVVPPDKAQLRFAPAKQDSTLALIRNADGLSLMKPIQGITPAAIVTSSLNQIKSYAISQFLKEFDIPLTSTYKVSIRVSSVDPTDGNQPPIVSMSNVPQLIIGKPAWVTIRNEGEEAFYYNILDFQPDGIVNVIVPSRGKYEPSELKLNKSESKTFKLNISKPTGMEMNRVFIGTQPFDLRLAFGFFETRGPVSPIEKLLHATLKSTRSSELDFDPSTGGVASYTFEIVDPQ